MNVPEWLAAVDAYVSVQGARDDPIVHLNDLGNAPRMCHVTAMNLPVISAIDPNFRISVCKANSYAL